MKIAVTKGIIFIAYHPQYLVDYVNLCEIDGVRSLHILIICRHTYLSDAIIEEYSKKFDHTIILPDVNYDKNIFTGFSLFRKFKSDYEVALKPILNDISSYRVVSCCSAWLPVNALLTALCHDSKFEALFTVCEHIASRGKINYLRSAIVLIYVLMFGLRFAYSDKILGYLYKINPWDGVLRFIGSYEKIVDSSANGKEVKICYIRRPAKSKRQDMRTGLVIFYSDRNLDAYKSSFSKEDRSHKLEQFILRLGKFYDSYDIVCKPHPLDKGVPVEEMKLVNFQLCDQSLITNMHLQLNIDRIVACYSVASTSLIYSASIGIPSYSIFKYLGYGEDENLNIFFDSVKARQNPFLYNLSTLEEIGKIDDIDIEPVKEDNIMNWDRIICGDNV